MPKEILKLYTSNDNLITESMCDEIKWPNILRCFYFFKNHLKQLRRDNYNFSSLKTDTISSSASHDLIISHSFPNTNTRAVVVYLHTIFGDNKQQLEIASSMRRNNIGFVSYDRSGNPRNKIFGSTDDLKQVIYWVSKNYKNIPILLVGSSAGTILLTRFVTKAKFLKKYNIIGCVMMSPTFDLQDSCLNMNKILRMYILSKLRYKKSTINNLITKYDPKQYFEKISIPCLILSSVKDELFHKNIYNYDIDKIIENKNIIILVSKYGRHVQFYDKNYDIPVNIRILTQWAKLLCHKK